MKIQGLAPSWPPWATEQGRVCILRSKETLGRWRRKRPSRQPTSPSNWTKNSMKQLQMTERWRSFLVSLYFEYIFSKPYSYRQGVIWMKLGGKILTSLFILLFKEWPRISVLFHNVINRPKVSTISISSRGPKEVLRYLQNRYIKVLSGVGWLGQCQ